MDGLFTGRFNDSLPSLHPLRLKLNRTELAMQWNKSVHT